MKSDHRKLAVIQLNRATTKGGFFRLPPGCAQQLLQPDNRRPGHQVGTQVSGTYLRAEDCTGEELLNVEWRLNANCMISIPELQLLFEPLWTQEGNTVTYYMRKKIYMWNASVTAKGRPAPTQCQGPEGLGGGTARTPGTSLPYSTCRHSSYCPQPGFV